MVPVVNEPCRNRSSYFCTRFRSCPSRRAAGCSTERHDGGRPGEAEPEQMLRIGPGAAGGEERVHQVPVDVPELASGSRGGSPMWTKRGSPLAPEDGLSRCRDRRRRRRACAHAASHRLLAWRVRQQVAGGLGRTRPIAGRGTQQRLDQTGEGPVRGEIVGNFDPSRIEREVAGRVPRDEMEEGGAERVEVRCRSGPAPRIVRAPCSRRCRRPSPPRLPAGCHAARTPPKSTRAGVPSGRRSTFEGLMSRWMTGGARPCRYSSTSSSPTAISWISLWPSIGPDSIRCRSDGASMYSCTM